MKKALICSFALLTVIACSKGTSPTEPLGTGTLITTVLDAKSNAGISNVTVELRRDVNAPLVMTATTNSAGVSEIAVPAGNWSVHVVPPAGYSYGGAAELTGSSLTIGAGGIGAVTVRLTKS